MRLLKIIFAISFVIMMARTNVLAQDELDVVRNNWVLFSDAPNSLNHYLTVEALKMLESRAKMVKLLQTQEEWHQRQTSVRKTLWEIIGSFPEKTNLKAKITGTVKKDGYRLENLIYESLPGFYVTASLFIPDNVKKPAPAILFCSGHSSGVYRLFSYQLPLLNLVKKGFIVLAFDPIGQGERLQYFDSEKGGSITGGTTLEHSFAGNQVFLTGKSIARYFLWDGIRGIDYLVSRPEVDPKRIGVHGLSGGGTQTAYIAALDERIVASASAGYITSYRRILESIGVQDGEQVLYHEISRNIDHADFLEIMAPKPTLIMATTSDFFSIQGSRETFAEVKEAYKIFGKPENIEITEDDGGHGYTKKNREAMYAFFQKHLQLPGSSSEEEVDCPTPQELQKTSSGQLSTSIGGETVFSLNRREAKILVDKLLVSRVDLPKHLSQVVKSAKHLSGYHEPGMANDPVFTGRIQRVGYVVEKYFVKGEGEYVIPYLLMIPDNRNNKALIYLHPSGKSTEAVKGGEIEWFVKKGFTVLASDLIGVGEMGYPEFKGNPYDRIFYSSWFTSMIIGRSVLGMRTGDVVRLSRLLKKNIGITEVYGLARKEMTPVLLHAAAFDEGIKRIALIEPYSSYQSVVLNRFYFPGFVQNFVPGALTAYDLPDLEASLAPRKLLMVGTTDGNGKKTDQQSIDKDLSLIRNAYQLINAGEELNIATIDSTENFFDLFINWIK